MGQLTISMVIFNSYVSHYQGVLGNPKKSPIGMIMKTMKTIINSKNLYTIVQWWLEYWCLVTIMKIMQTIMNQLMKLTWDDSTFPRWWESHKPCSSHHQAEMDCLIEMKQRSVAWKNWMKNPQNSMWKVRAFLGSPKHTRPGKRLHSYG